MLWEIIGFAKLPNIIIDAESFDEALEKARKINREYCAGRRWISREERSGHDEHGSTKAGKEKI